MEKGHDSWHVECDEPLEVRSLTTVARELVRYKLDLVGVQEIRWDKWGTDKAGDYIFFFGKGNKNHQLGTEFLVHDKIA